MKLVPAIQVVVFCAATALLPKARATAPPLPPLDLVLQRVMQTSAAETAEYHAFNQHYFYTRDKVTEFFDSAGHLKSRQDRQSTNNPVPAPVLSAPPPARQVPDAHSHEKPAPADQPNVHGVALGKKEDLLNPDVVKRFKYALVGREMLNGRPALIVDFQPVSDKLPLFNLKDRFIDSIAGRAWVEEADFTLAKVD